MREKDIRPEKIFREYLKLAELDARDFFSGRVRNDVPCPACGSAGEREFTKTGFDYRLCGDCRTLYVSPRPEEEAFRRYYTEAPSTRFWAEKFYPETEPARRKSVFGPKALMVSEKTAKYAPGAEALVDIGAGYGTFLEEFAGGPGKPGMEVLAIEPSGPLSEACGKKGLKVIRKFTEELDRDDLGLSGKAGAVFTSFELLEHVYTPREFLRSCSRMMREGDILIFTTLNANGFDIQLLWEKSKSVFPPHHLNFFNPRSVEILLEAAGLDLLEVTTPGKLDVDIVANNLGAVKDRFFRTFFETASPADRESLQSFLRENKLSSHMMAVAAKKCSREAE
ncbi:MAG: methyltransferase domain-containing protein [Candidatus Omnitrophica bacterium]|nr:methyltransferase domain-containing protein [Candidatus Omnitrophota bacterium]